MPLLPSGDDANDVATRLALLTEWVAGPLLTYVEGLETQYRAHCNERVTEPAD